MGQRDKTVLVDDHITCTPYRMSVQPMDIVRLADCLSRTWSHHFSVAILVYAEAKTWSPSVSRVQSRKTLYVSCYRSSDFEDENLLSIGVILFD